MNDHSRVLIYIDVKISLYIRLFYHLNFCLFKHSQNRRIFFIYSFAGITISGALITSAVLLIDTFIVLLLPENIKRMVRIPDHILSFTDRQMILQI